MDDSSKKNSLSILGAGLTEILIALLLVAGILATLNYFNIIPVSDIVPALSFLPKQESGNLGSSNLGGTSETGSPAQNQAIKTMAVVQSNNLQKYTNKGEEMLFEPIASSSVQVRQLLRIDVELSVNNSKDGSGITFNNSKKYTDESYKALHLFRYIDPNNKGSNWVFEYRSQGKSTYTVIAQSKDGEDFRKFGLIVSADGKNVFVSTPGLPTRVVQLADSFFGSGKLLNAFVDVAPDSELTVYSLYYQY